MGLEDEELERIITLKRTPLFRYIPFETMVEVARSVQPRVYLAGEEVMTDSTGRQDLLILGAGVLSIGNPEGAVRLSAPACFGEAALVGERMPWPRITAVEDSRVWFLRATIFQELCHEHPEMAIELCKLLARRVREASETMPQ
jgi:CRP-like cAMP-binding protein